MAEDGDNPTAAEPAVARRKSQPVITVVPKPFEPGELVAKRYRITKLLAHGGMGDVYEATDTDLRTDIALKTIRGTPGAAEIERFRREIFLARKVTHPNVCRVFDLGRHEIAGGGEVQFITMELLRGETLSAKLKLDGKLGTSEALSIVKQIAAAVDAAHAAGVVHRDLKPGNVMLVDGRALVTDFGVAHASGDPFDHITGTGDVVGSPAYMSPEQIEGGQVTPSADIYALGIMMFEMVTGVRPFQGESSISAIVKRLKVDPPKPTQHVPDLPIAWETAIMRCLARDPAARFATCQEVVDALTGTVTATRAADATVLSPPRKRSRTPLFIGGAIALALVGGVVAFVMRDKGSSSQASASGVTKAVSIAVLPFADRSPQKDQEYLSDGFSEELLVHLARVKDLRVVARSSAFSFKNSTEAPAAIAGKLGVTHLVEGSVAKIGDRVHITARLIRAADGTQLWAESFDRTGENVFAMQDEIANAVAKALEVNLVAAPAPGARTTNAVAHEHLLKGRAFARRDGQEDLEQAASAFEAAIDLDPSYAPAYAGLAYTLSYLADFATTPEARVARMDRARQLARKAVALGPDVAEAHRVLGHLQFTFDWEWEASKKSFARALELEPRDADTLRRASMMYGAIGDLERASALSAQCIEVDPVAASAWNTVGIFHAAAGRLVEARKAVEHSLELNPKSTFARSRLAMFDVLEGKGDAALEKVNGIANEGFKLQGIALAELARGNQAGSQTALDKLIEKEAHTFAFQIAQVFAWRGEVDKAFEWLDKAYDLHDAGLQEIRYDPLLAKIRPDPRYKAFLAKMRMP